MHPHENIDMHTNTDIPMKHINMQTCITQTHTHTHADDLSSLPAVCPLRHHKLTLNLAGLASPSARKLFGRRRNSAVATTSQPSMINIMLIPPDIGSPLGPGTTQSKTDKTELDNSQHQ